MLQMVIYRRMSHKEYIHYGNFPVHRTERIFLSILPLRKRKPGWKILAIDFYFLLDTYQKNQLINKTKRINLIRYNLKYKIKSFIYINLMYIKASLKRNHFLIILEIDWHPAPNDYCVCSVFLLASWVKLWLSRIDGENCEPSIVFDFTSDALVTDF